jgi:hypothetical protein
MSPHSGLKKAKQEISVKAGGKHSWNLNDISEESVTPFFVARSKPSKTPVQKQVTVSPASGLQ